MTMRAKYRLLLIDGLSHDRAWCRRSGLFTKLEPDVGRLSIAHDQRDREAIYTDTARRC